MKEKKKTPISNRNWYVSNWGCINMLCVFCCNLRVKLGKANSFRETLPYHRRRHRRRMYRNGKLCSIFVGGINRISYTSWQHFAGSLRTAIRLFTHQQLMICQSKCIHTNIHTATSFFNLCSRTIIGCHCCSVAHWLNKCGKPNFPPPLHHPPILVMDKLDCTLIINQINKNWRAKLVCGETGAFWVEANESITNQFCVHSAKLTMPCDWGYVYVRVNVDVCDCLRSCVCMTVCYVRVCCVAETWCVHACLQWKLRAPMATVCQSAELPHDL